MAWVDQRQAEFLRVRSEAIRLVKTQLEEAGLTLPSPEFLIRLQPALEVGEARSRKEATPSTAHTVQADVSVDRAVDVQIEVERQVSGEDDLLDEDPTPH